MKHIPNEAWVILAIGIAWAIMSVGDGIKNYLSRKNEKDEH
jgi:hypothetical protein